MVKLSTCVNVKVNLASKACTIARIRSRRDSRCMAKQGAARCYAAVTWLVVWTKYLNCCHITFCPPILPCELSSLEVQFESWCQKWANTEIDEMPKIISSKCLEASNATFMPGIDALLRIFATTPASVAEAERSFSALKLLKTYLRSTMTEERVSALALAYIHSDMKIDSDVIISKFAVKNRRLKFT